MAESGIINKSKLLCKKVISFFADVYYNFRWKISSNRRNNNCLNQVARQAQVVVSMTSFPERIDLVEKTIRTILNQNCKPDKILLWLAYEQFDGKKLPEKLLNLEKYGLEIKWCSDLRSYKKLIPTLKEYPNSIIVTSDDDAYYKRNWLNKLYTYFIESGETYICCNKATKIFIENNNLCYIGGGKYYYREPSFLNQMVGVGGVLYPAYSLDNEVMNENLFMELAPTNDDIWFWIMAVKKGTKIAVIPHNVPKPIAVVGSYKTKKLTDINEFGENLHQIQFNNILNAFPGVKEKLIRAVHSSLQ